jgi:hypothetical protein
VDPVDSQSVSKADEMLDHIHDVQGQLKASLRVSDRAMIMGGESSDFAVSDSVFLKRTNCARRPQVTCGTFDALGLAGSRESCRMRTASTYPANDDSQRAPSLLPSTGAPRRCQKPPLPIKGKGTKK